MRSSYDAIFADEKGTQLYYEWIQSFLKKDDTILECACGTGDLFSLFATDYKGMAFDLDEDKIADAQKKFPELAEVFFVGDFLNIALDKKFDALYCVNDSTNHIMHRDDLEKFVAETTKLSDLILLDSHHPYRLEEFAEPYLEEGHRGGIDYAYQISVENDKLIHIINYLDGTFDTVYQWVFDPKVLIKCYEEKGFTVDVFTDFTEKGISKIGEKVMYVIRKDV